MVRKYLAPSPATAKGRIKKQKANVRSTRKKNKKEEAPITEDNPEDYDPTSVEGVITQEEEGRTINVFACAALGDAIEGTFYTDMTEAFPTVSLEGMQAYFIAYD